MSQTIKDFIKVNGIIMKPWRVPRNPYIPEWNNADHWKCIIRNKEGYSTTIYFSKGYAFKGKAPTLVELLRSLQDDMRMFQPINSSTIESLDNENSFGEFCDNFGYTNPKEAYRAFKATIKIINKMYNFLGEENFNEFMKLEKQNFLRMRNHKTLASIVKYVHNKQVEQKEKQHICFQCGTPVSASNTLRMIVLANSSGPGFFMCETCYEKAIALMPNDEDKREETE